MSRIEELEAELALVSELIEKYEELKQIKGRTVKSSSQYIPDNNNQLYREEYNHLYSPENNHIYIPEYNHTYIPDNNLIDPKDSEESFNKRLYPNGEPFMAFKENPLFHYHPESYRDVVLVYNGQILDYKKPDKKDAK